MKSLIVATTLLAGALVAPFAASAASYAPSVPTAAVQEAASQKIDVHDRRYQGGRYYYGPLQRFLQPHRYGYHSHDNKHRKWDDHKRHRRGLSDRERFRRWDHRYRPDEDFDVQKWNRDAKRRHHSR